LRDWRQRGIDHEGVQSVKTAERLGLLKGEVQAFFMEAAPLGFFLTPFITPFACLGFAPRSGFK
jgi:hypothetical protein